MGIRMKADNSWSLSIGGDVIATREDASLATRIRADHPNGSISLHVRADGLRGLKDDTNNQYFLWYNPETDRREMATIYFTGSPYVANNTYWPSLYFKSSNKDEDIMGRISYPLAATENQTAYDRSRFYFYQYSYVNGTR